MSITKFLSVSIVEMAGFKVKIAQSRDGVRRAVLQSDGTYKLEALWNRVWGYAIDPKSSLTFDKVGEKQAFLFLGGWLSYKW